MTDNAIACERLLSIDSGMQPMPPPFHDELLHACAEESDALAAAAAPTTPPTTIGTQEDA